MHYYIGVDGGGTKTCIALFDSAEGCIDTFTTAGSNHEGLSGSFGEASDIITDGITTLLGRHGLTLKDAAAFIMGLAGVDHEYQRITLVDCFNARGIHGAVLFNDGFLPVLAGSDGAGIGYNTGTGSCAAAIDSAGQMKQLGGIGDFSNDLGNGYWITSKVFYSVYEELLLRQGESIMTGMYFDAFDIHTAEEFLATIPLFYGPDNSKPMHQAISIFFNALAAGDWKARRLADIMTDQASALIHAFIKTMDFPMDTIPVILSGSIHTKAASAEYITLLQEKAQKRTGRTLSFHLLSVDPVQGCRTYWQRHVQ